MLKTIMLILVLVVPAVAMGLITYKSFKECKAGVSGRKIMARNLVVFALIAVIICTFAFSVSAAGDDAAAEPAEIAATADDAVVTEAAPTDNSKGLGLIAAALVTSLSGIGGGIAVAAGAPAAIAAAAENDKSFGKSLIFVALGESIALYGVVISILILNKI